MSRTPTSSSLLAKPLYVFTLPAPLLDILTVRSLPTPSPLPSTDTTDEPAGARPLPATNGGGGSLTCQTCLGAGFASIEEQRAHFKSDWHRYNAKVAMGGVGSGKGRGVLMAEEFEEINDGLSSLSGTASSSGTDLTAEDGAASTDRVTKLLKRQRLQNGTNTPQADEDASLADAEEAEYRRRAELRTAMIWFRPDPARPQEIVAPDTQLGIYRAVLPGQVANPAELVPALRAVQSPLLPPGTEDDALLERKFTLLMVAGGHFAGMVVSLKPLAVNIAKGQKPEKQDVKGAGTVRILQHKTFHRYTTRKKQGGSQGLNDQAKGNANSAGAMLRRYGEQSLMEDIQALMIEWADDIRTSEKIFLRASTHGKRSFWGYKGAVLDKGDERIRMFPFPTRRPTQSELLRCFQELTTVKISHLSEDAIKALEDAYIASLKPKVAPVPTVQPAVPAPPKPVVPKLSPEEEAYRDRRRRLVEMVRKGRLEPLAALWEKHAEAFGGVDARVEEWVDEGSGLTLLMNAAQAGQEGVVKWLLDVQRADPTVALENVKRGATNAATDDQENGNGAVAVSRRTAYDFASTKEVRSVFRRMAHDHPDLWDWIGAGHIPSGLSEEQEQEQERKKADRRKGLREKAKEREAKRAAENPIPEPVLASPAPPAPSAATNGPQRLGGGKVGGAEGGLVGLTPEMRAKIERERRARAAEARLAGR